MKVGCKEGVSFLVLGRGMGGVVTLPRKFVDF